MVHTQPVSNSRHLQVKPIKTACSRQGPKDLPHNHGVFIIVGKRGSGKSTSAASLISAYAFDKIYVISPTCRSKLNEPILQSMGNVQAENCYDDPSPESLQMILDSIEEEERILEDYKRKMKLWNTLMKSEHNLDYYQLNELVDERGELCRPEHAYGGHYPCSLILFDDIVGSTLIRSRALANAVILHRHLANGNGASMMFLTQSFISDSSGLPKIIRLQCTVLLLFKTYSEKELESVSHECRGEVTHEKFKQAYDIAMQGGDHSFLLVDFLYNKNNAPSMFRRNLNEYIIL
eukprot:1439130-Pleurochrysis_carterae.AAC.2